MLCLKRLETSTTAKFASRVVLGGSFINLIHPISLENEGTSLYLLRRAVAGLEVTGTRVLWEDS
jgi:hypothetical protein